MFCSTSDAGGGFPLLHLHGEAAGCPSLPSLFQIMLLCMHSPLADRTTFTMPPLSSITASSWIGQLSLGWRGDTAVGYLAGSWTYKHSCWWLW